MTREMLEKAVASGEVIKTLKPELAGGHGLCIDYADVHPRDLPSSGNYHVYTTGHTLMDGFSTIGMHQHNGEFEIWIIKSGEIECKGVTYKTGDFLICMDGGNHEALNLFGSDTIIWYAKYRQQ